MEVIVMKRRIFDTTGLEQAFNGLKIMRVYEDEENSYFLCKIFENLNFIRVHKRTLISKALNEAMCNKSDNYLRDVYIGNNEVILTYEIPKQNIWDRENFIIIYNAVTYYIDNDAFTISVKLKNTEMKGDFVRETYQNILNNSLKKKLDFNLDFDLSI